MAYSLPLTNVVPISVTVSSVAAAAPTFNTLLIVGTSTVIPSVGATGARVRSYSNTSQMLQDGFTNTSPEYVAATLYFSQIPAPQYLRVGRQDLTGIATATVHTGNAGTGYVVGDILTVVQTSAQAGQLKVTTIGTGGAVTGVALVSGYQGTGYSVATALLTTGGSGTGAEVDITAVGETPLQALQACRNTDASWYACMVCGAVTADHEAIAPWIQSVYPVGFYFFTTSDAAVLNGTAGNVGAVLLASNYNRVLWIYSTTQGGIAPNNAYAAAAVAGKAMGLNTGLANSNFDLMFKSLVGVTAEPITQTQSQAIEALGGNVYVNYQNTYTWLEKGGLPSTTFPFFDQVIGVDMLVADIEYSVINLLVSQVNIPQTNAGQSQILAVVDAACDRAVTRGFVAPGGVWRGNQVLKLNTGDPLPKGYLVQSDSFLNQSSSDRAARKGMPVYVSLSEAGSVQSLQIAVSVQQ